MTTTSDAFTSSREQEVKYTQYNPDPDESHEKVLPFVPAGGTVVEVGCATGYLTERLEAMGCEVLAVEPNAGAARIAAQRAKRVHCGYVNEVLDATTAGVFDCVLVVDVLEHVVERDAFVAVLSAFLNRDGRIVFSVPNIGHWRARLAVLRGRFPYSSHGIFDDTHVRFYTKDSLQAFLTSHDLVVKGWAYTLGLFEYKRFPRWLNLTISAEWYRRKLLRLLSGYWPELFAYQFVVVAERSQAAKHG